jgi:hypothetical protein
VAWKAKKWLGRDGIKQKIIIDLDQSFSLIGEEVWSSIPAAPASSDITSNNEVVEQTVLFGSNISNTVNKDNIEKLLYSCTRYIDLHATCLNIML